LIANADWSDIHDEFQTKLQIKEEVIASQKQIGSRQSKIGNQNGDCSLAGIKRCTVDAEIASSSLVSPANFLVDYFRASQVLADVNRAIDK
jgi:hypothetical protein